jgi:hypothetical protein
MPMADLRNGSGPVPRTRKRVLVVNCYFDDLRQPIARTKKVPPALGPVFLAGAFCPERCDIRLYNEGTSGPLQDARLLAWPDMLVLTGLTSAFDRMLHVTAYARTLNPKVIVVAGGPAVRALPTYARRFFDYPCQGDIEQLQDVIGATLGKDYAANDMVPRFDLADWIQGRRVSYAESSRYCNFHCTFCSLTGEGRRYRPYDLEYVRRQILASPGRRHLVFIDNNFYGNDRHYFLQRLALLKELWRAGRFGGWAAIVTNDLFLKDDNLRLAREAGCEYLFSGVESFDIPSLRGYQKVQNLQAPATELIRKCLDAGIVFLYGLILDVTRRRLADIRAELDFITATPEITLPSFLTLPVPLLGTPFFHECLAKRLILPNTMLRDLNSTTLALRPLDPLPEVAEFVRGVLSFRGFRRRAVVHTAGFFRRYRRVLHPRQLAVALSHLPMLCMNSLTTAPFSLGGLGRRRPHRTHITSTEPLDPLYKPAFPLPARYAAYFRPTMVTGADGALAESLIEDLG